MPFAQSNRLYDDLPVLLSDINHLIQCEASGLHDTARNSNSRTVAPFLDDRTHNAFPGPRCCRHNTEKLTRCLQCRYTEAPRDVPRLLSVTTNRVVAIQVRISSARSHRRAVR